MSPPPPSTLSSLPSLSVTNSVVTNSGKQVACQTAIYVIVTLVIVAIICGTILLIWNDDGTVPIRRRLKLESVREASTLVQWMIHYFFTTRFPAIQDLRRTAAGPRPEPSLPLFPAPAPFREPYLAPPRPAMARDRSMSRIPSITYAGSYPPIPGSPSLSNAIGSVVSAP